MLHLTSEFTDNTIGIVRQGAEATGVNAGQVLGSAKILGGQATQLKTELERFLKQVRAA